MTRLAPHPRWLALLLAMLLTGCGKPDAVEAHPALWRVADKDTTIWLFGSIHALPPGVQWQTPALAQAIAAADTLILEVPPAGAEAARGEFLAVAQRDGLPPIRARVAVADRGLLERGMASAGLAPESLDRLKTWAAALTIDAAAGQQEAASAADGVEPVLTAGFAGRAIGALETRGGQFAAFDRLPEASQRLLLLQAAQEALDPARGYALLLKAWAAGDAAALAATLDPVLIDAPIRQTLVIDRNRRWTNAIVRRMARPGRVLIAVGAGHLVGTDSVVAMLRARGMMVERVK